MTDSLLRRVRPKVALAPLQRKDLEAARELCALRPVAYVMPAMHVERAIARSTSSSGRLWALHSRANGGRELVGVLWDGVNLFPAVPEPTEEIMAGLADAMTARLTRPSGIVGEAEVVLGLWRRIRPKWGPARAVREEQWLMALDGPPVFPEPSPARASGLDLEPVRTSDPEDFDAVLPAAIHMFKGEIGYDPTQHGRGVYEDRLRRLIRHGRSFVQFGTGGGGGGGGEGGGGEHAGRRVVFMVEAGIVGPGAAEIQGVWVEPTLRGQGLGREGLAVVCEAIQARLAPTVSLYVNSYNRVAIAAYEAVGFRRVGTFSTVML
ncbi:MAG: GNAT family N-acetyltransferase [Demequinaceae bacterium]|nr:GNAT family N-acetyltransferase [Demequinaceae bacterium]